MTGLISAGREGGGFPSGPEWVTGWDSFARGVWMGGLAYFQPFFCGHSNSVGPAVFAYIRSTADLRGCESFQL